MSDFRDKQKKILEDAKLTESDRRAVRFATSKRWKNNEEYYEKLCDLVFEEPVRHVLHTENPLQDEK